MSIAHWVTLKRTAASLVNVLGKTGLLERLGHQQYAKIDGRSRPLSRTLVALIGTTARRLLSNVCYGITDDLQSSSPGIRIFAIEMMRWQPQEQQKECFLQHQGCGYCMAHLVGTRLKSLVARPQSPEGIGSNTVIEQDIIR